MTVKTNTDTSDAGTLFVHEGLSDRQLRDQELRDARTRFFPAWWMYIGTDRSSARLYQVMCEDEDELELARAAQPDVVRAEYSLAVPVPYLA